MNGLSYVLHGDGTSDRMLMPILRWMMETHFAEYDLRAEYCDRAILPEIGSHSLAQVLPHIVEAYDRNLLFIHRDAESEHPEAREKEIEAVVKSLNHAGDVRFVSVVPVRMSETWLLIDEQAIRRAAGNPNGRVELAMPRIRDLETLTEPKQRLCDLLREACDLGSMRRRKFRPLALLPLVSDHIRDFKPLRQLSAFQRFERAVERTAFEIRKNYSEVADQAALRRNKKRK